MLIRLVWRVLADVFNDRNGASAGVGHTHSAIDHGHIGINDDTAVASRTSHQIHTEIGSQESFIHQWQQHRWQPHTFGRYPISLLVFQSLLTGLLTSKLFMYPSFLHDSGFSFCCRFNSVEFDRMLIDFHLRRNLHHNRIFYRIPKTSDKNTD